MPFNTLEIIIMHHFIKGGNVAELHKICQMSGTHCIYP